MYWCQFGWCLCTVNKLLFDVLHKCCLINSLWKVLAWLKAPGIYELAGPDVGVLLQRNIKLLPGKLMLRLGHKLRIICGIFITA